MKARHRHATAACAAILGFAALAASAYAQDTAQTSATTDDNNVVVVSGIRKGLQDSLTVKRKSTSIVEAVSAEDIGKLPDASIAESWLACRAWPPSVSVAARRRFRSAVCRATFRRRC